MAKQNTSIKLLLYFFLVVLLLMFLFLNAFKVVVMETGFFTRFVLSLLVVVLLLPLVPKIKIFDVIEIKRETKMFS
ncbi:MAG: hypothetical protein V1702_00005, partial [Candidatus Woesearchaeota archaeon]